MLSLKALSDLVTAGPEGNMSQALTRRSASTVTSALTYPNMEIIPYVAFPAPSQVYVSSFA